MIKPQIVTSRALVPFNIDECTTIDQAAGIAGKTPRTMRRWCIEQGIGRRIGGHWAVSRVALQMYLDGNEDALAAYHDGARAQYGPVADYYRRLGLGVGVTPQEWYV
jgi:hypothetical protein